MPAPDKATDTATGAASSATSASGAGGGAGAGAGAVAASSSTAAAHFSPAQVYIGSPAYPVSTSLPAEPKRESLSAVETVMHTLVRAQRAALMQRALVLATLPHIANSKGVILEHRMPVGTSAPAAASRRSTEGSDGSAMATPLTCALVHGVNSQVWTLHLPFIMAHSTGLLISCHQYPRCAWELLRLGASVDKVPTEHQALGTMTTSNLRFASTH